MDTPKTEEKTTTVNAEGNKSEAPKKKKNIIRVFHAQNASDGGKGRRKPAAGEKKGPARSQNGGQRPAGQGTRNNESGEQRREVRAEVLKEEETEETVSAVEQTVAREARADVPKAEEAETTVSAEQTVVARAADSVRDREEAVALQMLYSLRS